MAVQDDAGDDESDCRLGEGPFAEPLARGRRTDRDGEDRGSRSPAGPRQRDRTRAPTSPMDATSDKRQEQNHRHEPRRAPERRGQARRNRRAESTSRKQPRDERRGLIEEVADGGDEGDRVGKGPIARDASTAQTMRPRRALDEGGRRGASEMQKNLRTGDNEDGIRLGRWHSHPVAGGRWSGGSDRRFLGRPSRAAVGAGRRRARDSDREARQRPGAPIALAVDRS